MTATDEPPVNPQADRHGRPEPVFPVVIVRHDRRGGRGEPFLWRLRRPDSQMPRARFVKNPPPGWTVGL